MPATVRLTAQQTGYISGLLAEDSSFVNLIRSHKNIRLEDEAIVLDRADAASLRDYFGDRLAAVGFDANYEPNKEGALLESLIDALFPAMQ
ncbi:MAG TPA: hypothetical protein VGR47_08020 [Terracidiphilus sp.]|nr:hypothetical protein [Terracidiphilus sp.]